MWMGRPGDVGVGGGGGGRSYLTRRPGHGPLKTGHLVGQAEETCLEQDYNMLRRLIQGSMCTALERCD